MSKYNFRIRSFKFIPQPFQSRIHALPWTVQLPHLLSAPVFFPAKLEKVLQSEGMRYNDSMTSYVKLNKSEMKPIPSNRERK